MEKEKHTLLDDQTMLLVEARKNSIRMACLILSCLQQRGSLQDLEEEKKGIVSRRFGFGTTIWANFFSLSTLLTKLYNGELIIKRGQGIFPPNSIDESGCGVPSTLIW